MAGFYSSNPSFGKSLNSIVDAFAPNGEQARNSAMVGKYDADRRKVETELAARDNLAAIFSGYDPATQNYDQVAPKIAAGIIQGGYANPAMASLGSMLPGLSADQASRNYLATGKAIGKDNFFSLDDRDNNAVYTVGAGQRAVRGDGDIVAALAPEYTAVQNSIVNRNNAAAAKSYKNPSGASKIPKFGSNETSVLFKALAPSFGYDDPSEMISDLATNPTLQKNVYNTASTQWEESGGNLMNVITSLTDILSSAPKPADSKWYQRDPRRFQYQPKDILATPEAGAVPKVETIPGTSAPVPSSIPIPPVPPEIMRDPATPIRVQTMEEAMKVPSGTLFTTPDGVVRIKP